MVYFRNKIKVYVFLVLGALVVLGVPPISFAQTEVVVSGPAPSFPQTISVAVVQEYRSIQVVSAETSTPPCSIDSSFVLENLQAALSLNLNQPAQCFSVALGSFEVQPHLAMASPPTYALSFVNYSAGEMVQSGPQLANSQPELHHMLLPSFGVEYENRRDTMQLAVAYTQHAAGSRQRLSSTPSLSMLSVLRC